ncbi:sodium channel modifier 1-like [Saccostrea echinata]|uniref:sodium channel modifier 1-like n=1 Tax=Saccostrea echinata TaxID=191078 RepID=UPI002A8141BF|nr:sodium channel modifier 1-like [Saccostrea echinata]
MSFKRDGDDTNQLGVLRKRRVKELFAEDIPEDEALLTSNGRFACLVCTYRPVFDTVIMLSQHRKGKKHEAYMEQFQEKKDELEMLIKQRKHEQYLKDGTTNIKQATISHKGLGCGHKYDPRVKKKFHSRKTRVSLGESSNDSVSSQCEFPMATDISSLPGERVSSNSSPVVSGILKKDVSANDTSMKNEDSIGANVSDQFKSNKNFREHFLGQKGPFLHEKQLKNIFSVPKSNHFNPVPYKRKATENSECDTGMVNCAKQCRGNETKISAGTVVPNHTPDNSQQSSNTSTNNLKIVSKSKNKKTVPQRSEEDERKLREKQKLADKYLYYRGGGWKKNWKGEWVKDEDVEFDSDEEPPDLP